MGRFRESLRHAWNAFRSTPEVHQGPPLATGGSVMGSFGSRPHVPKVRIANERSIIASVYATIAVDVSDIEFRHAIVDEEGGYVSTVKDGLQYCLAEEANIDQGARAFRQNVAAMMLDKGVAAIVPVDTTGDPFLGDSYDIQTMRVGEIINWYPQHVTVRLYDDRIGQFRDITLEKRIVAIVENPFFSVMNEPNSTLQRLIHKLNLMDVTDDQMASGKLDMIIQLGYSLRHPTRQAEAEQRRADIEQQLAGSKYGIAYADSTEKITQLNRPVENDLFGKVDRFLALAFSQLGITEEIMNGTADEATMTNYQARTVEPIVDAIAEAMHRKFLSKTARTRGHAILYFRDPFKLIPITRLAEIADVMSRNEILALNDIRKYIGIPPSKDKKADELHNSNMPERPNSETPQVDPPRAPRFVSSQMAMDEMKKQRKTELKELEAKTSSARRASARQPAPSGLDS